MPAKKKNQDELESEIEQIDDDEEKDLVVDQKAFKRKSSSKPADSAKSIQYTNRSYRRIAVFTGGQMHVGEPKGNIKLKKKR